MSLTGKRYLSHRGYAIEKQGNEALVEQLKKELTVKPRTNPMMFQEEVTAFPVYRENQQKLYLPKNFGLDRFGVPNVLQMEDGEDCPNLIFNGIIRPNQEEPVQAFLDATHDNKKMGGILSLPCGMGKTVIALRLSSQFKKKTLVVCHTEFLMDQWIERIEQYLPTARTGKIKQKICQVEGNDIVIASLQSLAMRDYDSAIFKDFGFVVLDECHHLGAEVFSRCLPKITCKIMLGLSATLKRKDGLSKVFEWYLGKPVFTIKRKDSEVKVLVERFYDPHPEYGRELKLWNTGKLNVARMINKICEFPPRNHRIVQVLKKVIEIEPNRKVLILSERRTHLQDLESLLRLEQFVSIGYYVGGMSKKQLDEGSSQDIILATFQLASEAMDIPKLNTLILGSPVSSIEQPIGRIQRKKKEEREYIPLVIDILDEFSIFERQAAKRIAFYKKNEYEIVDKVKDQENQQEKRRYTLIKDDDEDQ
uniref:Helicase ATP-binding domain-containing protein n=1 Tax=viral metagenome TaxID=1070528 RepID=A0A6C0CTV3_9ZZZZ